jgi:hypothetical protein
VAAQNPRLHIFDWASIVAQHPEWVAHDGVHLTATGYRQRSLLIAQATMTMAQANRVSLPTTPVTAASGPPAGLQPLDPSRILDTRQTGVRLAAGETRRVDLSARVPNGATAAAVNLTVDAPAADGYLTSWDCAGPPPTVSSLNYTAGQPRGASAVVGLADDRSFCVFSLAAADLVVDVNGAYTPGAGQRFTATTPARLLDTRTGTTPNVGGIVRIPVPAVGGVVPSAVTINLTATGASAPGFLTAFPCRAGMPVVSNVNYQPAAPTANLATVKVGADGSVCVFTMQRVDVIVDLLGVYGASGLWYQAAVPVRVLDTRTGTGGWLGAAASLQKIVVDTTAINAVPATAQAIVGAATVTDAWGSGFVTTWPCAASMPTASTLNYALHDTVPNVAVVGLGADRGVCVASYAPSYLLFDLTGWFTT